MKNNSIKLMAVSALIFLQLNNAYCKFDDEWEVIQYNQVEVDSKDVEQLKKMYKKDRMMEKLGQHILAQPGQTAFHLINATGNVVRSKLQNKMDKLENFLNQTSADRLKRVEENVPNQLGAQFATNVAKKAATVARDFAVNHIKHVVKVAQVSVDSSTKMASATITPYAAMVDAAVGDPQQLKMSALENSEYNDIVDVAAQKMVQKARPIVRKATNTILAWWNKASTSHRE